MTIARTLTAALMGLGAANAASIPGVLKRSPAAEFKDGSFLVDRQSEFQEHVSYSFEGGNVPEGLYVSDYTLEDGSRSFLPGNANVRDGYLELLVPGGQGAAPLTGGEISTTFNMQYGSVRTVAILTEESGVCNGIFFYKDDTQETDIEWLSNAQSNQNEGTRQLWLTNQDANGDGKKTYTGYTSPADPTNTEHEYRIDWTADSVKWFVDGEQVWEASEDVPSAAGPWIWNNWTNEDKFWAAGPPAGDAVFKIKSIEMYYNPA